LHSSEVEQWTENPRVSGSIPLVGNIEMVKLADTLGLGSNPLKGRGSSPLFDNILFKFKFSMKATTINFLLMLKNSSMCNKEQCVIKKNKTCLKILQILYKEGLIQSFSAIDQSIIIQLRYKFNKSIFKRLSIISKPSKEVVCSNQDLNFLLQKTNFLLVETNKGLKTGIECKLENLGGNLLFIC
jgi:ribosomal protein S8